MDTVSAWALHPAILVDLVYKCIEPCRRRFACVDHIEYHVNDGRSLDAIENDSIDYVFSMDSLVHADPVVMREYTLQLGKKSMAAVLAASTTQILEPIITSYARSL